MQVDQIQMLWDSMNSTLNESQKRKYAASLANAYGYGGATIVHHVTGLAMNTITRGKKDLSRSMETVSERVQREGGGPKLVRRKISRHSRPCKKNRCG